MKRDWSWTALLMALSFLAGIMLTRACVDPQLAALEADDQAVFKQMIDCQMQAKPPFYYDQDGAIRGPRRPVR